MSPSKADLERTIDRLRAERDDARNSYAELVKEKTLYAQSSGSLLFELGESYPSLAETVSWLYKAHHAASALPEKTGGSKTADSHHVADPAGDKAAAEDGDTHRLKRIDGKLAAISAFIRDHLGERGPLPDRLAEKSPVCNNPDCPAFGWPQDYEPAVAGGIGTVIEHPDGTLTVDYSGVEKVEPQPRRDSESCRSCGDSFGAHRPKPRRFDTEELVEVKRCWKRGCGGYSKVRSCPHSI